MLAGPKTPKNFVPNYPKGGCPRPQPKGGANFGWDCHCGVTGASDAEEGGAAWPCRDFLGCLGR